MSLYKYQSIVDSIRYCKKKKKLLLDIDCILTEKLAKPHTYYYGLKSNLMTKVVAQ